MPNLPLLITVTGPSGTGKDAVIKMLCKKDENIQRFVTATTRSPRPGEENGVHYHFLTREDFLARLEKGEFAEHNGNYHGNLYGTLKVELDHHFTLGHHVVSDINIDGVHAFRESYPGQHVAILLLPPSKERLLSRLTQRNPELAEEGMERFKAAGEDLDHLTDPDYTFTNPDMRGSKLSDYDAIFTNDDLEVSSFKVYSYLQEEIAKRKTS